jgi:hypothetical protein
VTLSGPVKKEPKPQFGDSNLPEPEIELTGFNQPSMFGQILSSGLNAISSSSGKKKNNPAPPQASTHQRQKNEEYKPTWNQNFEPNIEHTNFTSAISEFNKQSENPNLKRIAPPPLIIRRQKPPMPFIYKFAIFAVFILLALGGFMYADKHFKIRQTIQELKDPSKTKLKIKRKPVSGEE